MSMRRLVLVRHGESAANSAQRLIGSGDPPLAAEGRSHLLTTRAGLVGEVIDLVVASPARRAWQSARVLVGDGVPVRLESDFREIHFGRWEGRRVDELEAADPVAWQQWRDGDPAFEYPGGELRAAFRARVDAALERLLASGASSALVVAHKGVIRAIHEKLTGHAIPDRDRPALAEALVLTRRSDGTWFEGRRSSNPPGLETPHPIAPAA